MKKIYCKNCKRYKDSKHFTNESMLLEYCIHCLNQQKTYSKNKSDKCIPGIYKVVNKITNKVYIGQTKNLRERKKNYFLKKPGYINKELKNDILKYGVDSIEFFTILVMRRSNEEERLSAECFYKLRERKELYNVLPGKEDKEAFEEWKKREKENFQKVNLDDLF